MESVLQGIRIADFTAQAAGPYGLELLAFMGAEVIRIENRKRPDITRKSNPLRYFEINLAKKDVTIDLTKPRGVDIAKALVAKCDVVAESFTPGVMKKLGLDYASLKAFKPDIIMLSLSGFGQTGPESRYRTYAPIFGAVGGLSHITGYSEDIPSEQRAPIDLRVGQFVAFAIMWGLLYRQRTGKGQHIDLAARDSITCLLGDVMAGYSMNQKLQIPRGNQDEKMAPHGVYRCQGEDRWVSIAAKTEDEWQALCSAMGHPEWRQDERFKDAYTRWQNQEELDRLINEWTSRHTREQVVDILQSAGVASMLVSDNKDLFESPHLRERGFIVELEGPGIGKVLSFSPPWKFDKTSTRLTRAPDLGEHNHYVLGEIVGLSPEEISRLEEEGVLY